MRRSVLFVHWPVFQRELGRYKWARIPTEAPDVIWGNNPDPAGQYPLRADSLILLRRTDGPLQ